MLSNNIYLIFNVVEVVPINAYIIAAFLTLISTSPEDFSINQQQNKNSSFLKLQTHTLYGQTFVTIRHF